MDPKSNLIQTCLGRLGAAIAGVFLGWVPFLGAIVLLFWNEGRTIKTQRALNEGTTNVVEMAADRITPANEGCLVHVQGTVSTTEQLTDPLFNVTVRALRLRRVVEMYQWRETTERQPQNAGQNRKEAPRRYEQTWSAQLIDSSCFKNPTGHYNPSSKPFDSAEWVARRFQLGAFSLESDLREQLNHFTPLGIRVGEPTAQARQAGFRPLTASFYRGHNESFPQVGDVRVVFEAVTPSEVSVIGGQSGNTLTAYQTKNGGKLALLRSGKLGAKEMFRDEALWNWLLTWACRVGGYLLMLMGMRMVLRPVSLIASIIPAFLGPLAFISGFLGFIFATAVALTVTALGWVFYRPQIGLPLAATGVLLSLLVICIASRRNQSQAEQFPTG